MNMHRLRRSGKKCLALLGILALCLTGCGKGETAEEASYENRSQPTGRRNGPIS